METKISSIFENDRVVILKNTNCSANKLFETGTILDYTKKNIYTSGDVDTIEVFGDITSQYDGVHTIVEEVCCEKDFYDYRVVPLTGFELLNVEDLITILHEKWEDYGSMLDDKTSYLNSNQKSAYELFFKSHISCYKILAEVNANHLNYNYCLVNDHLNQYIWIPKSYVKFDSSILEILSIRLDTAIQTLKKL